MWHSPFFISASGDMGVRHAPLRRKMTISRVFCLYRSALVLAIMSSLIAACLMRLREFQHGLAS